MQVFSLLVKITWALKWLPGFDINIVYGIAKTWGYYLFNWVDYKQSREAKTFHSVRLLKSE